MEEECEAVEEMLVEAPVRDCARRGLPLLQPLQVCRSSLICLPWDNQSYQSYCYCIVLMTDGMSCYEYIYTLLPPLSFRSTFLDFS